MVMYNAVTKHELNMRMCLKAKKVSGKLNYIPSHTHKHTYTHTHTLGKPFYTKSQTQTNIPNDYDDHRIRTSSQSLGILWLFRQIS